MSQNYRASQLAKQHSAPETDTNHPLPACKTLLALLGHPGPSGPQAYLPAPSLHHILSLRLESKAFSSLRDVDR